MLSYSEGDFKAGKAKIHYYRTGGEKPPFIMLHGATDNGLCWSRVAAALSMDYDVIMPDAQGHGLSDRIDADFSQGSSGDQIAALANGLGLKKPVIMGHSMGAGTAADVASRYPSLPRALVLEDPGWGMPSAATPADAEEARKRTDAFRARSTAFRERSLEDILDESRKIDPAWSEEDRVPWAIAKQQFDLSMFSRGPGNQRSYAEIVPLIDCPTLLICAEKGIVTTEVADNAARIWKSKKPFRWVRIMGAGHNIRREKLQEFLAAVMGFLREDVGRTDAD
jgi:pimeloyl-ACP methyl ester carboxylesterase